MAPNGAGPARNLLISGGRSSGTAAPSGAVSRRPVLESRTPGGIEVFRLDADRAVEFCDGLRRRDFLHAGALASLGLSLTDFFNLRALGATGNSDVNCI